MTSPIPLALAHDYVTQRGGAEKVALALHNAFPDAPLYTTLYEPDSSYPEFASVDVRTSWLNTLSFLRRDHRLALPLLPFASHGLRIDATCTIASSSGWAHGFRSSGAKIVYCHSPARWLYQTEAYLGEGNSLRRLALLIMRPWMRAWDRRAAKTAVKYFANSTVVQQRIKDAYGIDAEVLFAPHSVDVDAPQDPVDLAGMAGENFHLCVSRLLPYKNVDKVIEAFRELGTPLVVVGAGPEESRLAETAPANVRMLKNLSDAQMRWLYARASAVISSSYEDFGLTPIEAAAFGTPAVVLRWGGFLDTIEEGKTGIYFDAPEATAIAAAVHEQEQMSWDREHIISHAEKFSEAHFAKRLRDEVARISLSESAPS